MSKENENMNEVENSALNIVDVSDSDKIILYLKDNDGMGCYVGVFDSIGKFIELIKSKHNLNTFKIENKDDKLIIEEYFRGNKKQIISRSIYSYKNLKINNDFCYFK